MKNSLLVYLLFPLCTCVFAQGNKEVLFQIDTMQISPNMKIMVFKYFKNEDGYEHQNERKTCRFEISYLGESVPFQKDTINMERDLVEYEDANYDNILDMKINTNVGASGGETVDYYFYNPKSKIYEFGIGDLSNPTINKKDSTLSTEAHCCQGREGSSECYKYINGKYKLIIESQGSEDLSFTKALMGDSMVTIKLDVSKKIDVSDGTQMIVDSSWEYLFGKLRVIQIDKKKYYDESSSSKKEDGLVETDVMGSFIYFSTETFQYQMDKNNKLTCSYVLNKVKNKEWIVAEESQWFVKDQK